MASTVCNSFKVEILNGGVHGGSNIYKLALFTSVLPATVTSYTYAAANYTQVSSTNYTAGGLRLGTVSTTDRSGTATWDFAAGTNSDIASNALTWNNVTFSAQSALIYNDTAAGKNAVAVIDFGGTVTATNGTFVVTLPAAGATTSLVRITSA